VRPSRLHSPYVSPSASGRGVGSQLYRVAEPLLAGNATLWVLEANTRGREFWERRGWQHDGKRRLEHDKGSNSATVGRPPPLPSWPQKAGGIGEP
jgi:ribosomal protein S18 acetylase RimI-like enzyme